MTYRQFSPVVLTHHRLHDIEKWHTLFSHLCSLVSPHWDLMTITSPHQSRKAHSSSDTNIACLSLFVHCFSLCQTSKQHLLMSRVHIPSLQNSLMTKSLEAAKQPHLLSTLQTLLVTPSTSSATLPGMTHMQ